MIAANRAFSDEHIDRMLGRLLRGGVVLAAAVVLLGGMVYLVRHGSEPFDHRIFEGEPENLRRPVGIVQGALAFSGRGLIQLGLLLLIATPVARVVFSVFAFGLQRDYLYVLLTLVVLGILLYGLFGGSRFRAWERKPIRTL